MDVCCLSIDRQNYINTNKAVSCLSLGLNLDCARLRQFLQLDDKQSWSDKDQQKPKTEQTKLAELAL